MTRGTVEVLAIRSDPSGATARLSNGMQCTTPCGLLAKRRGDLVVTVEKAGYVSVQATLRSTIDRAGAAGMAGNVVMGVVAAGVDMASGALYSHHPNPLVVELEPLAGVTADADGGDASTQGSAP